MAWRHIDSWRPAAEALGLTFEGPVSVELTTGSITVDLLLKHFGGAKGTLIVADYEVIYPHRETVLADVRRVVAAALAGDFSGRIDERSATDDLRDFVASLNSVMTTVERGVEETGAVLDDLSNSDLSRRVEGDYQGVFELSLIHI